MARAQAISWTARSLPRLLLVIGSEAALREEAVAAVKTAVTAGTSGKRSAVNWIVLHAAAAGDARGVTPADVLDEVCTASMFAEADEMKVVLVRNAEAFLSGENREIFERNVARIPNSATLILEAANFGMLKNTNFYKGLAKQKAVVECASLAGKFGDHRELSEELERRARAKGLLLSYDALQALVDRSAKNIGILDEELDKLVLALRQSDSPRLGGGHPASVAPPVKVSVQDVENCCSTTSTFSAFNLADALIERDRKQALEVLGGLFDRGMTDPKGRLITSESSITFMLLGALTWKLSQIQDVMAAIDAGKREQEAFAAAKVPPFKFDAFRRTLRKHSRASLRRCMEALFRANLDLRMGSGPRESMEQLVWKF